MPRRGRNQQDDGGRSEERRRQLLESAAASFARHGYHRATAQGIADEAGVAAGTIYNYFQSKRDLLLALLQAVAVDSLPAALAHVEEAGPDEWLTQLLRDRVAMLDRNRALLLAVAPEMITDEHLRQHYMQEVILPAISRFRPVVRRAISDGHLRPFNLRVVLPALVGALVGAFAANEYPALPGERVESPDELVSEIVALFLDGLRRRDLPTTGSAGARPALGGQVVGAEGQP